MFKTHVLPKIFYFLLLPLAVNTIERKLKTLTVLGKINLIKSFEKSSLSKTAFSKQNGIARGTFNGIIVNKEKLLNNEGKSSHKRNREGLYGNLKMHFICGLKKK